MANRRRADRAVVHARRGCCHGYGSKAARPWRALSRQEPAQDHTVRRRAGTTTIAKAPPVEGRRIKDICRQNRAQRVQFECALRGEPHARPAGSRGKLPQPTVRVLGLVLYFTRFVWACPPTSHHLILIGVEADSHEVKASSSFLRKRTKKLSRLSTKRHGLSCENSPSSEAG